jgi:hypothetical protein
LSKAALFSVGESTVALSVQVIFTSLRVRAWNSPESWRLRAAVCQNLFAQISTVEEDWIFPVVRPIDTRHARRPE